MLLMLTVLMLAQANGLYVPPWCWLVFAAECALNCAAALGKIMKGLSD